MTAFADSGDAREKADEKTAERRAQQEFFSRVAFGPNEKLKSEFKACMANWRDRDGHTPLMLAACYGNREAAEFLLPRSDANAQSHNGYTALMCALSSQCFAVARLLAPASDLTIKNKRGGDALSVLFRSMSPAAVTVEMAAPLLPGADPMATEDGAPPWTAPFAVAASMFNWAVVDAFLPHVPPEVAQQTIEEKGASNFPLFIASQEAKALHAEIARGCQKASKSEEEEAISGVPSDEKARPSPGGPSRRL